MTLTDLGIAVAVLGVLGFHPVIALAVAAVLTLVVGTVLAYLLHILIGALNANS